MGIFLKFATKQARGIFISTLQAQLIDLLNLRDHVPVVELGSCMPPLDFEAIIGLCEHDLDMISYLIVGYMILSSQLTIICTNT